MGITVAMVKELRQATGAGVLDCRKALEASAGDLKNASAALREKGLPSEQAARHPTGAWRHMSTPGIALLCCWN